MRERLLLSAAVALAAAVRVPFWHEALRTPVDGDAAIQGLMARHPLASATFWGQPYGSPLEAWLTLPFVLGLGPSTAAARIPGFLLGLALVPLAYALGRALDARAGLPAALLLACPSSYMLLLSALPPPLYPTALAASGLLLLLSLALGGALARGERPQAGLVWWGALGGLALWTHLMTGAALLAGAAYLVTSSRAGGRRILFPALLALALASAPAWWPLLADPAAPRALGLRLSLAESARHGAEIVPQLHVPLRLLFGAGAPWLADLAEPVASTPEPAAAALLALELGCFLLACASLRRSSASWTFFATLALSLAAFCVSRRAGPSDVRFLAPLYLPAAALAAWGLSTRLRASLATACVAAIALLNLAGGSQLLAAWRSADRAEAPFHLPDLAPVRGLLEARGIDRAYAAYAPAYRLTYESGEQLIVSQFRNERFPDRPLPYLDEVRYASRVAWILTPAIPSDMPTPAAFENDLRGASAGWQRTQAGAAAVFHDFVPPFAPGVEPLSAAGRAGDGELSTAVLQTGSGGVTYAVAPPLRLDAITLAAPPSGQGLPKGFALAVADDRGAFETVARRKRGRERRDLLWSAGQVQYLSEPDLISIPLAGRRVAALRLVPSGAAGAWSLGELLLHPAVEQSARPWQESFEPRGAWAKRRAALAARPLKDRVDWYARSLIAARHRGRR